MTMLATSSALAARPMIELARCAAMNSAATASIGLLDFAASSSNIPAMPSDSVGPGRTALTVTPVPAICLASPRATATSAVLLTP